MEFNQASKLSYQRKISIINVVREYWEMYILNELYTSEIADALIFKGGTALRLIYNSPRYSEDLDFAISQTIKPAEFKKIITKIINSQPELSYKDLIEKKNTLFALIKVKQDYLPQTISIKIEISTRKINLKKNTDFVLQIAYSETTVLKPLISVYTLPRLLEEKKEAIASRGTARDLFDMWFIGQLLKQVPKLTKIPLSRREIKRDLNKLLPVSYHPIIKDLMPYAKA